VAYKKLESMQNLVNQGLNVHKFVATKDVQEIKQAVHNFDNVCTIRTDSESELYKLPFYIINGSTVELDSICNEIKEKGLLAIVANGLKYDKHLRYNIVYTIEKNGDFWCEYNMEKCTLRDMYKYPMNCYIGNINERIWDWVTIRQADKRIDKRILRDTLIRLWYKGVYGKYVEASVYTENCGMLQENIVFWQIVTKSNKERELFKLYY